MKRALRTAAALGIRVFDGRVVCPHCLGGLALRSAAHFAGVALCPHEACGRRLVVEVDGRDVDGRPLEFRVRSTVQYVRAVQPLAGRVERRGILLAVSAASLTSVLAVLAVLDRLAMVGRGPLSTIVGLTVLATVSWSAILVGGLTDVWMRAFLWRRSLVMEEPSASLSTEFG